MDRQSTATVYGMLSIKVKINSLFAIFSLNLYLKSLLILCNMMLVLLLLLLFVVVLFVFCCCFFVFFFFFFCCCCCFCSCFFFFLFFVFLTGRVANLFIILTVDNGL